MTKSHENDNNDDDEFMHVCIIIIFLLIRLFYSLIHSLNHLLQTIQFYSMLANLINLAVMFLLTAYCMQNHLPTQFSHNMNAEIKKIIYKKNN